MCVCVGLRACASHTAKITAYVHFYSPIVLNTNNLICMLINDEKLNIVLNVLDLSDL